MSEKNTKSVLASEGDVVLREVWRAKDTLSAAYDHDLERLCAESRERERRSSHKVVNLSKTSEGTGKP
jgi:hypothetical protein